ncbi:hypothetical protein AKJ08_1861 [Vulgatibacter incomptus]|uniref:Uncharacterized protein n=1 Tax=Vulgatibacter incomptus TaxID=1391653 RepID=A0A0K1PEB7_9BACT|nr:hypothetical protein AKJ08_1861 [Vulgatibacter incomptus]
MPIATCGQRNRHTKAEGEEHRTQCDSLSVSRLERRRPESHPTKTERGCPIFEVRGKAYSGVDIAPCLSR